MLRSPPFQQTAILQAQELALPQEVVGAPPFGMIDKEGSFLRVWFGTYVLPAPCLPRFNIGAVFLESSIALLRLVNLRYRVGNSDFGGHCRPPRGKKKGGDVGQDFDF